MNGKIYYTDEDLNRGHKRFRICKNKGNECIKEEFMAKHASSKFCSEDCNNKFSNWEKHQIRKMKLSPKKNNIKILNTMLQNNFFPIVSYHSLVESNFRFEESDGLEFVPSIGEKVIVYNEFRLIHWEKDKFLINKKQKYEFR